MNALWSVSGFPWWHLVIRAGVVYLAIVLLLRLSGKRQVGQMGMADFVALLLISNAVQNSMNGGDNSITGGLILATVLILLSYGFNVLTYRSRRMEALVQGRPTLLVHHGKLLHHNLERELLTVPELRALLRRQGVHDVRDVAEAVLESDGYLSITKKSEMEPATEATRSNAL